MSLRELERPYVAIVNHLDLKRATLNAVVNGVTGVGKLEIFRSADAAMESFASEQPHLVITDFIYPENDSSRFLQQFRQTPEFKETPVIAISDEPGTRNFALLNGATDFLAAPFDALEFRVRVGNLLQLGLHQKILSRKTRSLRSKLIATRLRSLKTFRKAKQRYTSVIDSVPALILVISASGECVFASRYCLEFLGCPPRSDVAETSLRNIVSKIHKASFSKKADKSYSAEMELVDKNGLTHTFLISARVVPKSPHADGLVVFSGIDISDLKSTEYSLRLAKEEAEAANKAKNSFFANMSHEIRTPLNAVIGFSELINAGTFGKLDNERYAAYIKDILHSSKHLLFIIDEILDFSKMEDGQHEVSFEEFSIIETIMSVRRIMENQFKKNSNRLLVEAETDLIICSDRQKISQILINIVSNANKFMENGIIRLAVQRDKKGNAIISVEDNGLGMSEDEIAIAVSRFGRVGNPSLSKEHRGVGLGLPISIGFMKLLGGKLEISSRKGEGTTVNLIFPGHAVAAEKKASAQRPRDIGTGSV
jgi:two-component system cell cycle sensor histidine kinase PleC